MSRFTPFLLAAAFLVGSCGEAAIPRATAQSLQDQVADVRAFVENGQVFAARQRLDRLRNDVNRLMEGEKLDSDTAMEILSAVEDVEAALDLAPERSPVSEPTTEPTTPPPPPEEDGDEEGIGHGNDEDKDKEKEKEKDKGGGHGDEGHGNDD